MRGKWSLVTLVVAFVIAGCESVPRAFLEGEEAVYKAISEEYVHYINADVFLSEEKAEDRRRTIRAWKFALDRARKELGD